MEIVQHANELERYMREAVSVSNDSPVLLDHFLNSAVEVDVDVICDGEEVLIGGIMEHIEEAGIHSGDSACCLPPQSLSDTQLQALRNQVTQMALALEVVGLMNTQFAIKGDEIYVLEVNPRASRTVPFVSKATGQPLAKIAALCMAGVSLKEQKVKEARPSGYSSVKESVFPFAKFPGVDPVLGPEMKSTGEVMGSGKTFGEAFYKASLGASSILPERGKVFISVKDQDKAGVLDAAKQLINQGFSLIATDGTFSAISGAGISCQRINKLQQGQPHILDEIKNGEIALVINTTDGRQAVSDSGYIRQAALQNKTPYTTTLSGALAICAAVSYRADGPVYTLSEIHQENA
jgi:carbamoyl-phosphate synthase large subunit